MRFFRLMLPLVLVPFLALASDGGELEDAGLAASVEQLRYSIGLWSVTTEFLNEDETVARSLEGTYEFEWVVPDRVVRGKSEIPAMGRGAGILFYVNEKKQTIEMVSVGADGYLWIMTGPLGEETRYTQEFKSQSGKDSQLRFTRFNIEQDTFESRMEFTDDGGKTWKPGNHQMFRRLGTSERIEIESGEWRLAADLVLPSTSDPVPAVILLNKAAGDRSVYRGLAEELAGEGIASLRLDLRGHGESINRGRFVPSEGVAILEGSEQDVAAAHRFLRDHSRVDPDRIGFVGASYSGESMMKAAALTGYGTAYVALSPGSFSSQSIAAIDEESIPFLFVATRHDRFLTGVTRALRDRSKTAQLLELDGAEHATDLLASHRGLARIVTAWFDDTFAGG